MPTELTCKHCGITNNVDAFYKKKENKSGYTRICRQCKLKEKRRNAKKRKYGITGQQYEILLSWSQGKCQICSLVFCLCGSFSCREKACIDHDHNTGQIRGLLCPNCNLAIGLLRDNPKIVRKAVVYLEHTSNLSPLVLLLNQEN